jgi:hypothetical protein
MSGRGQRRERGAEATGEEDADGQGGERRRGQTDRQGEGAGRAEGDLRVVRDLLRGPPTAVGQVFVEHVRPDSTGDQPRGDADNCEHEDESREKATTQATTAGGPHQPVPIR